MRQDRCDKTTSSGEALDNHSGAVCVRDRNQLAGARLLIKDDSVSCVLEGGKTIVSSDEAALSLCSASGTKITGR